MLPLRPRVLSRGFLRKCCCWMLHLLKLHLSRCLLNLRVLTCLLEPAETGEPCSCHRLPTQTLGIAQSVGKRWAVLQKERGKERNGGGDEGGIASLSSPLAQPLTPQCSVIHRTTCLKPLCGIGSRHQALSADNQSG